MIILAAIAAAVLVLALQRNADRLADMREDHRPEERLVDPDEKFYLDLTLQNAGRHYILFARLEERLSQAFTVYGQKARSRETMDGGTTVSFSTWLRPRQEVRFRFQVSAGARGFYPLAPLKLSCGDFLGLEEHTRRAGQFRAVVVAPREAEEAGLAGVLGGFLGDVSVRRFIHEDPVLTTGFREYAGREPMKQISWTQSARGRDLMVKVFDHTAELQVSVLLNADTRAGGREALLEKCYSMARTVCRILEERGIPYDFATNAAMASFVDGAGRCGMGLGANHFAAVLDCLGRATYFRTIPGERFLAPSGDGSAVRGRILITPSDDFPASPALERLRESSGGNLLVLRADGAI